MVYPQNVGGEVEASFYKVVLGIPFRVATDQEGGITIAYLTLDYPLQSTMGRNGCVRVPDWYHPHRNVLTMEQQTVLSQLMETATEQQREVLRQMLVEYGSPKTRQTMNGGIDAG